MIKNKEEVKALTLRMPTKLWVSLKKLAIDERATLTDLIVEASRKIIKERKDYKKALTNKDTQV